MTEKQVDNLFFKQVLCGAGAGAFTKTTTAPLERIKILYQLQGMQAEGVGKNRKYRNIFQTAKVILKEEGIRAFWKGNFANVLRASPVYACKFTFNDQFKLAIAKSYNNSNNTSSLSVAQKMMAGTCSGFCTTFLTYPLEVVRTRLALGPGMGVKYTGVFDCLKRTFVEEGLRGYYKGLGPTLLSGPFYVGMQMTFYSEGKKYLNANNILSNDVILQGLITGSISGIVAQTITYPGDTIRRQMQSNGMGGKDKLYRTSWHCLSSIWKREGITGMFRGLPINVFRAIPGSAIQFATYGKLKEMLEL